MIKSPSAMPTLFPIFGSCFGCWAGFGEVDERLQEVRAHGLGHVLADLEARLFN
jgi:hypothetical protein